MPDGVLAERGENGIPALLASTSPLNESDALLRFFSPREGQFSLRARGLLKAASKLAPLLKPGDELLVRRAVSRARELQGSAAGGGGVLIGVSIQRAHDLWRADLDHSALLWWMLECCLTASGAPQQNAELYQLTVNLLRSAPSGRDDLYACASAFALKLLLVVGLAPDLAHCSLDGHPLENDEPAFLLPSGEGLVGRDEFNARYAKTGAVLPRLNPIRRRRWLHLLHGALLEYVHSGADAEDAGLLVQIATQQLADLAHRRLESADFLRAQWKLASYV